MSDRTVIKRLPHIALTIALAAAGMLFVKRPMGGPTEPSGVSLVDPALAQPWPEAMQLRLIVRERLAREVIAGRRSLLVAAAHFGQLNQLSGLPTERPAMRLVDGPFRLPGNTPGERLCRQVEAWVRVALRDNPMRGDAVLSRLEAECRHAPRRDGDLCLPDPASLEPVAELLDQARGRATE